ncbi:hypothetical protein [Pedobacter chitinilyticus]|uniref:Cell wall anchor protein n=1 Tax=Pedobacter chitinilyticus TaxID=2233776 RepID=A0A3S3SW44_9SPHI|nr:hypothetical protein [Pedobacter chitinilyticus]RWU09963.1 hypothetical protein DPV69_01035 [Pedobacter chitinilyticus]
MKSNFKKSLLVAMLCSGQAMAQQTINQVLTLRSNQANSTEVIMYKTDDVNFYSLFSNSSGFGLYNSNTNKNILYADINDRIGIGTQTPLAKLHVNGVIRAMHSVAEDNSGDFENESSSGYGLFSRGGGGAPNLYSFKIENYNGVPVMLADGNSNVGIGTLTPKEKLSVNGKIRAKEIKVELANWPDYVFEEGYQNQSLAEIEQFIKQNKHLPGVPTAKQVEQEGVELGEMNKVLLKKIEELTLHLIEKEKKLDQFNTDLKKRDEAIEALISRIEKLEKVNK